MEARKLKEDEESELKAGLFAKGDAARFVIEGTRHVHSSVLGESDPDFQNTEKAIAEYDIPQYSWEIKENLNEVLIYSSQERRKQVRELLSEAGVSEGRGIHEKLTTVCEELVSNGIFHAYNTRNATRYHRTASISLQEQEAVKVQCHSRKDGVFMKVIDQGGGLDFETLRSVFKRCYSNSDNQQIDSKEQGAGLGLYMVFETVSHLKIVVTPGVQTEISCWIADRKYFDPDRFSLDFFEMENESDG